MKIIDLINKKYNCETKYQRDYAWTSNNKSLFISSIMNDYFIPELIIANNRIIDGKQRYTTIIDFYFNKFKIKLNNNYIRFDDFTYELKDKFINYELHVRDLGELSDEKEVETFIRINKGSVHLNKIELLLAECPFENRNLLLEISKNEKILLFVNNKINDRRFSIVKLIAWCLTISHAPNLNTAGIRTEIQNFIKKNISNIDEILLKSNKVINTMYEILSNDFFPLKGFNVLFETIFASFWFYYDSLNSFIYNRLKLKNELKCIQMEISNSQIAGGVKYDSFKYISKRISKVCNLLDKYLVDNKRSLSYDDKLILWTTSKDHKCEKCNKVISDWNDFEADHHIPFTYGGKTNLENCRILCKKCNREKSKRII